MTRRNHILLAITTAIIVAGAVAAITRPEPPRPRTAARNGTMPEVVVTAPAPNTVVREIVVRGQRNLAGTTSAREALN